MKIIKQRASMVSADTGKTAPNSLVTRVSSGGTERIKIAPKIVNTKMTP